MQHLSTWSVLGWLAVATVISGSLSGAPTSLPSVSMQPAEMHRQTVTTP